MLESIYINSNSLEAFGDFDANVTLHKSLNPRPKARIYYQRETVGPKLINSIIYTKNLLRNKGVREEDIEEVALESHHDDFASRILDQVRLEKKDFPIIFVDDLAIGNIANLEEWITSSKISLDPLSNDQFDDIDLSGKNSIIDVDHAQKPSQIYRDEFSTSSERKKSIDRNEYEDIHSHFKKSGNSSRRASIEPDESITLTRDSFSDDTSLVPVMDIKAATATYTRWGMRYVGSAISSVANYLTSTPTSIPPSNSKDDKAMTYVEFEVVQINWYWREQKRVLRFANDKFFRLNPFTKELRSVHKYATIQRIVITGTNFMTICFNDESQPEYYRSEEISDIVQAVLSRSNAIPISYVNES